MNTDFGVFLQNRRSPKNDEDWSAKCTELFSYENSGMKTKTVEACDLAYDLSSSYFINLVHPVCKAKVAAPMVLSKSVLAKVSKLKLASNSFSSKVSKPTLPWAKQGKLSQLKVKLPG